MINIIIAIILLILPVIIILLFDREGSAKKTRVLRDEAYFRPANIFEECRRIIDEVLNSDYSELGLNRAE